MITEKFLYTLIRQIRKDIPEVDICIVKTPYSNEKDDEWIFRITADNEKYVRLFMSREMIEGMSLCDFYDTLIRCSLKLVEKDLRRKFV